MTATTTAAVVKEARFVLTNLSANNNKFWNIRLLSDGRCETHWGRVGEDGQRKAIPHFSEVAFDAKCREKQAKGYKPQKTLAGTATSGNPLAGEKLAELASAQIETNSPETIALVAHLARVNVHQILEATTLAYDEARGTFSTPLGIVTKDAINEARTLLSTIGAFVRAAHYADPTLIGALNDYLMLVPQNIGRNKPDVGALFPNAAAVEKQSGLLDALEASLHTVLSAVDGEKPVAAPPKLFEARLHLVSDPASIEQVRRKFRATQKAMHACAHLDVKRVFSVEIGSMRRAFAARGQSVGNVNVALLRKQELLQELWHGTRASNLLSILKSGFVIPAAGSAHCNGRMYGNGVYFSDQSTKSLNYAYGYWSGTRDETCYMFLCDVAMGRSYTPRSYGEPLPKPGYDSTFARAGKSGVANNEMIVYAPDRINPRLLVEFGPKGK